MIGEKTLTVRSITNGGIYTIGENKYRKESTQWSLIEDAVVVVEETIAIEPEVTVAEPEVIVEKPVVEVVKPPIRRNTKKK